MFSHECFCCRSPSEKLANAQVEYIYISLGSNVGDSETIILSALRMIDSCFQLRALSKLYRTTPQIVFDQRDFLNCVACFSILKRKNLQPDALLSVFQDIESSHGRNRAMEQRHGPRSLDIDLVFFGERIVQSLFLQIPHPNYRFRRFVLEPLMDINPVLRDPQTKVFLEDYAQQVKNSSEQGIYLKETTRYNSYITELGKRNWGRI